MKSASLERQRALLPGPCGSNAFCARAKDLSVCNSLTSAMDRDDTDEGKGTMSAEPSISLCLLCICGSVARRPIVI